MIVPIETQLSVSKYSFRCFFLGAPTLSIYEPPQAAAASNPTALQRSIPVNLLRTQHRNPNMGSDLI